MRSFQHVHNLFNFLSRCLKRFPNIPIIVPFAVLGLIVTALLGSCDTWRGAPISAANTSTAEWDEPYKVAINSLKKWQCSKTWNMLLKRAVDGDSTASSLLFQALMEGLTIDGEAYKYEDALAFFAGSLRSGHKYSLIQDQDYDTYVSTFLSIVATHVTDLSAKEFAKCLLNNNNILCYYRDEYSSIEIPYSKYLQYINIKRNYQIRKADCDIYHQ